MNTFKTIPDTELLLSTDGWEALENASQQLGINLTELWQKIASKEIILVEAEEMEDLLDTISGLEVITGIPSSIKAMGPCLSSPAGNPSACM